MENKSKKNNFLEWYKSIVFNLDLLKYYDISGCYVIMPRTYKIWELVQKFLDEKFKSVNVDNVYFPMLLSETNLSKESSHLEGFTPEVAWVTQAGTSSLNCKLAIRPTSECAFYPTFAEIIRSHNDLPLKWNQWCSVLRWEFNDPTPFIRSREFLWNEGHCAFSTKEEACANALEMLGFYRELYEDILCVPVIMGKKTTGEKFAGADDTYTLETYIPDAGRGIQCATSHFLGQNFSKIFNIKYQTQGDGHTEHAWQTSWGLTTRSIGTTIMVHSDDKGLVLPFSIAEYQIVIVPIFKKDNFLKIDEFCKEVANHYKDMSLRVHYDTSGNRPGWKYNYWEERGIPLRFEVGPKELDDRCVIVYCRTNEISNKFKRNAFMTKKDIMGYLSIHNNILFNKARKNLHDVTLCVKKIEDIDDNIKKNNNKLYVGYLCDKPECEETTKQLKIKPMCRPLNKDQINILTALELDSYENKCIVCKDGTDTDGTCLFGRTF